MSQFSPLEAVFSSRRSSLTLMSGHVVFYKNGGTGTISFPGILFLPWHNFTRAQHCLREGGWDITTTSAYCWRFISDSAIGKPAYRNFSLIKVNSIFNGRCYIPSFLRIFMWCFLKRIHCHMFWSFLLLQLLNLHVVTHVIQIS